MIVVFLRSQNVLHTDGEFYKKFFLPVCRTWSISRGDRVHGRCMTSAAEVDLLWKYSSRQSRRYKLLGCIGQFNFLRFLYAT
jgi:hypothetical protein